MRYQHDIAKYAIIYIKLETSPVEGSFVYIYIYHYKAHKRTSEYAGSMQENNPSFFFIKKNKLSTSITHQLK